MDDWSISMTCKVEVSWDSIDLEEALHSASSFGIDIFNNFTKFLLITEMFISEDLLFGQCYLLKVILDIHQMYFQNIFHIEGEEGAGVPWKLDIDIDFQFFCEMLLVNDEITVDFGGSEIED
jgi:hypothetical protein